MSEEAFQLILVAFAASVAVAITLRLRRNRQWHRLPPARRLKVGTHLAELTLGGALLLIGALTSTEWPMFGLFALLFALTFVVRRVGLARLRR